MRITLEELMAGCRAFEEFESRDPMYRVSQDLLEQRWGDAESVADALGVLLLTWNQAAYRYGIFNFDSLQQFLERKSTVLKNFRNREILGYIPSTDDPSVIAVFEDLLASLTTASGSRSPVAAAKALHLLAPSFFPLWDNRIASAFGCRLYGAQGSARKYVHFIHQVRVLVNELNDDVPVRELEAQLNASARFHKPILKFVDQYLYAKFTKGWV